MIIKIKKGFSKRKKLKILFKELKIYLKPGKYLITNNFTHIINKNYIHNKKNHFLLADFDFFSKKHSEKNVLYAFIKRILYLIQPSLKNNHGSIFKGEVLFPTNNYKSVKIFNFKEQTILTLYKKKDEFLKAINNYNYFKKYYNIPKIHNVNYENQIIEEELVEFIPISKLGYNHYDMILAYLFTSSKHYIQSLDFVDIKYYSIKQYIEKINHNGYREKIMKIDLDSNLSNEKLPMIRCHGDMALKNILFNETDIYVIDFELSNYYYFLYDMFTLIYFQFHTYNDIYYLDNYFAGVYDSYLVDLFSLFNLQFRTCNRLSYLKIYILQRLVYEESNNLDVFEFISKYEFLTNKYK